MATLLRFSRPGRVILARLRQCQAPTSTVRYVSTTKKANNIVPENVETSIDKSKELDILEKHFADTDPNNLKNWVSEGFSYTDPDYDRFVNNIIWFCVVSFMVVGGHFLLYYMPDMHMRDWATREAYLEIDKRRKAGLPLIDPYYIPPEQVNLPSEEELGDQEIII